MGVPSYFRWLAEKYGKTVVDALEEFAKEVDGKVVQPDLSKPNPNGIEFDNLYLDMNGIIHPCSHPENKPQPASEYEIMQNIFEYIDRLFSIVRPRRVFYLAIDGVAPRAKMNQQRSRRFKAAQESKLSKEAKLAQQEEDLSAGRLSQAEYETLRAESTGQWHFDSNCITPGTSFMEKVAKSLRWYAYDRLTRDPAWKGLQVIISDASVPGEGEHKIVDWIRRQKALPTYDPNTKHVLYGLDADLIMLGLATHEPHFTILREFVAFGKRNENDRFAREGGQAEEYHPYQFLRLNVLREYLAIDLRVPNLPFEWDLERAIDDYVFLCFFVGNDFLPHMPTLEIREGAIELLIEIYKKALPSLGGFITLNGEIDLSRAEALLKEVGNLENAILERRMTRNKRKQRNDWSREQMKKVGPLSNMNPNMIVDFDAVNAQARGGPVGQAGPDNVTAANSLKEKIRNAGPEVPPQARAPDQTPLVTPSPTPVPQNPNQAAQDPVFDGFEAGDQVRLGEAGWKERYYREKFKIDMDDSAALNVIARAYMEGLVWVLRYYYQGCCSWTWYFPYHYAPFAGDLHDMAGMGPFDMALGHPFTPFEQLMGVLPAASGECLPEPYRQLMTSPTSPIIDFYPETFELDLNGKKQSWHAVVLLPFIEEKRLIEAVRPIALSLSESERFRNTTGRDEYIVAQGHPNTDTIISIQNSGAEKAAELRKSMPSDIDIQNVLLSEEPVQMNPATSASVAGSLTYSVRAPAPGTDVTAPFAECGQTLNCAALSVIYQNPTYHEGFQFPASLHPQVVLPQKLLTEEDKKRPALFSAGAPASVILEAVMSSFHGGGGRGGGGGGRGGPQRFRGEGREHPYSRGGGRGGYSDRGGRGGYYGDRNGGYQGDRNGGYKGDRSGGYRNDRGGGYQSERGGRGGGGYYGGDRNDRGGRGGGYYGGNDRSDRGGGGRGGYNNRGGYQGAGGYSSHNAGYGGGSGGGYQPRQGFGGPSHQASTSLPTVYSHHQQQQPQQQSSYPSVLQTPQGYYNQYPQHQTQGYYPPPPQQGQQHVAYPPAAQPPPSAASLSASMAPMLAASAQSLGVHQPYFQPTTQGGFQTSSVNLQQLYHQQQQQQPQQARGPPYY